MNDVKTLLKSTKRIVITMHKNPDCDALGSSLGLCHLLNNMGHEAIVISPNSYPDFLNWLPGENEVLVYDSNILESKNKISDAEIIFCLDFNTLNRVGELKNSILKSKAYKILIDHHEDPCVIYSKYKN